MGEFKSNQHPVLVLGELGLISSLGALNMPIVVGSEERENPALYSKYAKWHYIFSSYDSPEFIDELCRLGATFDKKPVIFSDDDRAILNISNHRERLEHYFLMMYPAKDMLSRILDKQCFAELAETYQLPVPQSFQVSSVAKLESISSYLQFPCIIKPSQRHYWWGKKFIEEVGFYKKAIKCENLADCQTLYRKIAKVNPNVVIQEYVSGDDRNHFSANLFVNEYGTIKGYYIAQKLRIYPIKAGTGTCVVTVSDSEVLNLCREIIVKLGLKGLVNIQFKKDERTKELKLMEIHARNSLWSILGDKAGANLAELYFNHLTKGGIDNEKVAVAEPDVKYINLINDIKAFIQYRSEGVLNFMEWSKSISGDRVFGFLSLTDPLPAVAHFWYALKRRIFPPKKNNERSLNAQHLSTEVEQVA